MAKRTISCTLSEKSLRQAMGQLKQYQERLDNRNKIFVTRLAQLGIPIVHENVTMAQGDSDKPYNTYIRVVSLKGYSEAKLVLQGRQVSFIEFGAGVHYNGAAGSSPHPKGGNLGYTIGSYGAGHGADDYWYYVDDSGVSHRSYGTKATMPLYKASVYMRRKIRRIAKEVFGG